MRLDTLTDVHGTSKHCEISVTKALKVYSLVPPTPFFVLRFAFSIIHGSGKYYLFQCHACFLLLNMCDEELKHCIYHTERKLKNKKRGRPGNETSAQVSRVIKTRTFLRRLDAVA